MARKHTDVRVFCSAVHDMFEVQADRIIVKDILVGTRYMGQWIEAGSLPLPVSFVVVEATQEVPIAKLDRLIAHIWKHSFRT